MQRRRCGVNDPIQVRTPSVDLWKAFNDVLCSEDFDHRLGFALRTEIAGGRTPLGALDSSTSNATPPPAESRSAKTEATESLQSLQEEEVELSLLSLLQTSTGHEEGEEGDDGDADADWIERTRSFTPYGMQCCVPLPAKERPSPGGPVGPTGPTRPQEKPPRAPRCASCEQKDARILQLTNILAQVLAMNLEDQKVAARKPSRAE
tara:strand:+ start:4898 stop:5515 length:618 start_codon:yes stop_codon:yes gene_type:complete